MSEINSIELEAVAVTAEHGFLVPKLVEQFKQYARKSTENTLEMARIITEAKAQLPNNYFHNFCAGIGFDKCDSFVSKMKKIGERYELFKEHVDKLPVAYTTLYRLAALSVEDFVSGIESNIIHAQMTASELEQIAPPSKITQYDQKTKNEPAADSTPNTNNGFRLKFTNILSVDKREELEKELLALSQKYGFDVEVA